MKTDEVDRAVAATKRAVGRLVKLLGAEDPAVMTKAAAAIVDVGPLAVGPLASALPRSKSPRHRLAILACLMTIGPRAVAEVSGVLALAIRRERDPEVRLKAGAVLSHLMASGLAADLAAGSRGPRTAAAAR